jgi:hypothetical protein
LKIIRIAFILLVSCTLSSTSDLPLTQMTLSLSVAARNPHYGPHETKIIIEHVLGLLVNGCTHLCYGPWGWSIVLAAKPHQEHVIDILDFIWHMCISYCRLNQFALPFKYPIPHCDDAIDNFGWTTLLHQP